MNERYTHVVRRQSGYVAGWHYGPAEAAAFAAACNAEVPDDPASVEALDWEAWERWGEELEPHPAGHTCEQGPVCEQMDLYVEAMSGYADDPISQHYGVYPPPPTTVELSNGAVVPLDDCDHWTCRGLVYGHCELCMADAMDAYWGAGR